MHRADAPIERCGSWPFCRDAPAQDEPIVQDKVGNKYPLDALKGLVKTDASGSGALPYGGGCPECGRTNDWHADWCPFNKNR